MNPIEENRTYCVFGFWHNHDGKPYVMKDGEVETYLCNKLDDAIDFIKSNSQCNVNITWCLTWDKYEIDRIKAIKQ